MSKLKDAVLSSEMLAAGLAATGTAVASSPKARRAIYEAGIGAADEAGEAANRVMNSSAKLAALIGEAVAEAVHRALTSDLLTQEGRGQAKRKASSTGAKKHGASERRTGKKAAGKSNTREVKRRAG